MVSKAFRRRRLEAYLRASKEPMDSRGLVPCPVCDDGGISFSCTTCFGAFRVVPATAAQYLLEHDGD